MATKKNTKRRRGGGGGREIEEKTGRGEGTAGIRSFGTSLPQKDGMGGVERERAAQQQERHSSGRGGRECSTLGQSKTPPRQLGQGMETISSLHKLSSQEHATLQRLLPNIITSVKSAMAPNRVCALFSCPSSLSEAERCCQMALAVGHYA